MSGSDDEADLLAGEYVLGVLAGAEMADAERRAQADPAFARRVEAWRARLHPLTALAPPVPPPADMWARVEAALDNPDAPPRVQDRSPETVARGDNVVRLDAVRGRTGPEQTGQGRIPDGLTLPRQIRLWRGATAGSLALAAALAAFVVMRPPEPARMAVLTPVTGEVAVLVAALEPGGILTIRPRGALTVPAGRDLELWALARGETRPRSLGVLAAGGGQVNATLAPGTQLLVSLEPKGGSPTGQPTGPVLYGGTLTGVN